jgi:hypothetical protein
MLYEFELNKQKFKNVGYKGNIINKVTNNIIIDHYKPFRQHISKYKYLLHPYHYLKKIKNQPIHYFIINEIMNKYKFPPPTSLFSNSQLYMKCIYEMNSNVEIITKNKLCPYNKLIIYNYSNFINTYKNLHDTIIIDYEEYDTFITNLLVSLFIQKNDGTLIFNIPSIQADIYLNILHFLMQYYNIKIIKPFATSIYTNERYVICTNYKTYVNSDFLKYGTNIFNIIKHCKSPYLNISEIPYIYLNLIVQEETIWATQTLNTLTKYILECNKDHIDEKNKIAVNKWYTNIII